MKLDLKPSKFQLKTQRLKNVTFNINDNENNDISLEAEVNVKIATENNIACVELSIFINKDDPSKNFNISITNEGFFEWENIPEDQLPCYLEQNAPAVLLSFIRTTISNLTVAAGINPLVLPLLNFSKK